MKLETIKKALACYALSADCTDHDEVISALANCAAVEERYADRDLWHDEIFIITPWTLDNVLNQLTYDIYGKRKKIHGDGMQFEYYAHDCRKCLDLEQLTNESLQFGYEIISDLWLDNEREGNHNDDGTFKKQ